ncbi:hypothetical protein HJC23_013678 [Cyclotella cryptica]|uniref:Uncharacterized protein n=1 Tax=Cyclotella cryptica TaxID=29204 RepID=A0ABD3QUT3_9STRA
MDQINRNAINRSHLMSADIAQRDDMSFHQARKQPRIDYQRNSFLSERTGNKKQLRFAKTSTLIVTQPKTASEMESSWYSTHDIREFKADTKKSSQALFGTQSASAMTYIGRCIQTGEAQEELTIDDIEKIRGIEHLVSPAVCRVLFQSRRATIARVLQEQARQEEEVGPRDAEKLASVSLASSGFAKEWRRRIMVLQLDK